MNNQHIKTWGSDDINRKIEQAKREWEATADALPQLICLIDSDGHLVRSNRTVETWGLMPVSEVRGKSLHDVLHPACIDPDCYLPNLWQEACHAIQLDEDRVYEYEDTRLRRILEFQFRSITSNIEGEYIALYLNDITRRHDAEMALRQNLQYLGKLHQAQTQLGSTLDIEEIPQMAITAAFILSNADLISIAIMDEHGQLRCTCVQGYSEEYLNTVIPQKSIIQRVFEKRQAEFVKNVKADPDYNPIMPGMCSQIAIPLQARGTIIGVLSLETSCIDQFTEEIYEFLRLLAFSIKTAYDNAYLYQVSQEQLENLRELYVQVSNLEELKTEVIRLAAHDIRTPLMAISLGIDHWKRIEADELTEYGHERLRVIRDSTKRIKHIVDDILSLEKIYSMNNSDTRDLVDLSDLVRDSTKYFEELARDKRILFSTHIGPSVAYVSAEETQLKECISNLIDNAVKYTPEGGNVSVTLSENEDIIAFRVHDTGYGIPKSQQEQLFEPFYRAVQHQDVPDIEGTGLGLSLVKKIVERFDGDIYFESEFGEGSIFGFNLPLTDPATVK